MKKIFKNKNGQFYILTAIVLIAFALLTLQSSINPSKTSKNFKNVYDNFVFESSITLNTALAEQVVITSEYEDFLKSFISYSKMKKLRLEIFSIIETNNIVYFSNKMQTSVKIINLNYTMEPNTQYSFSRNNISEAVLEVRDDVFHENIYKFSISNQGTDAKAIIKVKQGNNREIFVQE